MIHQPTVCRPSTHDEHDWAEFADYCTGCAAERRSDEIHEARRHPPSRCYGDNDASRSQLASWERRRTQ